MANHGGARPGAGRKPKPLSEELRHLLDSSWPVDKRQSVIERAVLAAEAGDMIAFRTLMAYGYGTPPSGDEMKLQEGVDEAFENLLKKLETNLSKAAWREVEEVLGI